MERLNEKMGQLKAEFISRDGLRFNERKKNMNALVTIQRFVIIMSSKIALNCKIIPWLRLRQHFYKLQSWASTIYNSSK